MKILKANFEEIAEQIAKEAKPFKEVVVKNWNGKRLYVSYPGESKKYQDGGYVDLKTGYIQKPAYKEQSSRDKENNAVIASIGNAIFE